MTQEITLRLPIAMVNQCLEALAEQPLKATMHTFNAIQAQAQQQMQAAHDAAQDKRTPPGAPAPAI